MKVSELITKRHVLDARATAPDKSLPRSIERVLARWPNAIIAPEKREREALAMELLVRVTKWSWKDLKLSRLLSAAMAIFDDERRDRPDLKVVRDFLLSEIEQSKSTTFLHGMVQVYIENFDPKASHTSELAAALSQRMAAFQGRTASLVDALTDIFKPATAAAALARIMTLSDNPYAKLKKLGFRAPHGAGLTNFAHKEFIGHIGPDLKQEDARSRVFAWINPTGGTVLQTDAGIAIAALLRVWGTTPPPDDVRASIAEAIISAYNDPRTHHGGIWSGFDPDLKAIFLRWLTKQDMLFFCDMVSATQSNHMWAPRRDFWLQLYEDGLIDEAWVAFGGAARDYARRTLMKTSTGDVGRRFARQHDRGGSTSLLIMRIGKRIVVDGCHSYRTHIFKDDDPSAPKLYGREYYCDDIMRRAKNSKSHSSIPSWKDWVMRNV